MTNILSYILERRKGTLCWVIWNIKRDVKILDIVVILGWIFKGIILTINMVCATWSNEIFVEFGKSIGREGMVWLIGLFNATFRMKNTQRMEVEYIGYVVQERGWYPKWLQLQRYQAIKGYY